MTMFSCALCIKEDCEKRDSSVIQLWSYAGACGLKPIVRVEGSE